MFSRDGQYLSASPSKKGVRKLTTKIDGFRFGAIIIRGSVTGLNATLRGWSG
jgi:hypothetical protein